MPFVQSQPFWPIVIRLHISCHVDGPVSFTKELHFGSTRLFEMAGRPHVVSGLGLRWCLILPLDTITFWDVVLSLCYYIIICLIVFKADWWNTFASILTSWPPSVKLWGTRSVQCRTQTITDPFMTVARATTFSLCNGLFGIFVETKI